MNVDELIEMANRPHQRKGKRKKVLELLETKIKKNEKKIELFNYLEEKITNGSN
jgi:uncharacterized protein YeeX (DUF496 family)